MSPRFNIRAKERPVTDYERWLNYNPNQDPSSAPKYEPDRKHRYVDGTSVRFTPNPQLMSNDHRYMPPPDSWHPRYHQRIAPSQGLVRGITFFCAVLVVLVTLRTFVALLIRAAQRRRDVEGYIQDATRRQEIPAIYVDNNELEELR